MHENIYGHDKRIDTIKDSISTTSKIAEFGCGTGVMVTLPLVKYGYDCVGFDIDSPSIAYGKSCFAARGFSPDVLSDSDFFEDRKRYDVIIVSEVLEHVLQPDLDDLCDGFFAKLNEGGILVVTVPNGYGWFEIEDFIWKKFMLGVAFEKLRISSAIIKFKRRCGIWRHDEAPSSLSSSPHVQRFTLEKITALLKKHGFSVAKRTGTVFLCGPLSNLLFTGLKPVMKFNKYLGKLAPAIASGFIVVCRKDR